MGKHFNKLMSDRFGGLEQISVVKYGQKLVFFKNSKGEILIQHSLNDGNVWVSKKKIWDILLMMFVMSEYFTDNLRNWFKEIYGLDVGRIDYTLDGDLEWWKTQI